MAEKKIPPIPADKVLIRPGMVNQYGATLLLYCDSRYVMSVLDDVYGRHGWQREHKEVNGSIYCSLSVWTDEHGWISREDVGTSGAGSEEEKTKSSDSLKRAAASFGICRSLYTAGLIWLKAGTYRTENRNGKITIKDKFHVDRIAFDEENENITELVIKNQDNVVVYEKKAKKIRNKQADMQLTVEQTSELTNEMKRTGVTLETVLGRYGLSSLNEMNQDIYEKAMRSLKKTEKKVA